MLETSLMVLGVIALVCFIILSLITMVVVSWYYVTFKEMFDVMKDGVDTFVDYSRADSAWEEVRENLDRAS